MSNASAPANAPMPPLIWWIIDIVPLIRPNRADPKMLPENITVNGAVIRNVNPYSSANTNTAGFACDSITSTKIPILITKQSSVGRAGPMRSARNPDTSTPSRPITPIRASKFPAISVPNPVSRANATTWVATKKSWNPHIA